MKILYFLTLLLCANAGAAEMWEVTVPNFESGGPPCIVKLPSTAEQCTNKVCKLPLPKGASLEIHLTCLPPGSLTGIERPPYGAWEEAVRVGNSNVNLLLMDGYQGTPEEGTRTIDFCIIGNENYFCGAATTPHLKRRARRDATNSVKAFIKGVEWPGALPKSSAR